MTRDDFFAPPKALLAGLFAAASLVIGALVAGGFLPSAVAMFFAAAIALAMTWWYGRTLFGETAEYSESEGETPSRDERVVSWLCALGWLLLALSCVLRLFGAPSSLLVWCFSGGGLALMASLSLGLASLFVKRAPVKNKTALDMSSALRDAREK